MENDGHRTGGRERRPEGGLKTEGERRRYRGSGREKKKQRERGRKTEKVRDGRRKETEEECAADQRRGKDWKGKIRVRNNDNIWQ